MLFRGLFSFGGLKNPNGCPQISTMDDFEKVSHKSWYNMTLCNILFRYNTVVNNFFLESALYTNPCNAII